MCLLACHAQQHLEFDVLATRFDAAGTHQMQVQRDVEEVVACDAEAHVLDVVLGQCVVEDRFIVRVSELLGGPHGLGPAAHLRFDLFHR